MSPDPSEIILICRVAAQETFISVIKVENSYKMKQKELKCPVHTGRDESIREAVSENLKFKV